MTAQVIFSLLVKRGITFHVQMPPNFIKITSPNQKDYNQI